MVKISIVGHARHGKDTVADMFVEMNVFRQLRRTSSSLYCAQHVVYPKLREKYHYNSVQECFEDRHNHRAEWFQLIKEYSIEDPARLTREIFQENDIYVGCRNIDELNAARQYIDLIIWVDRSEVLPLESTDSMTIERKDADVILWNNGTLDDLKTHVKRLLIVVFIKQSTPF